MSLKVETIEKGVGICSLTYSTLGVEGCLGAPRWGLGKVTSGSFIHMDLQKLNNKLVNAQLEYFWCTDEPWAHTNSQDSSQLD